MKFAAFCAAFAVACGLLAVFAGPARGASAVAADEHGGFGYAYGDKPLEQLRQEAIRHCRETSRHPDDVHVIATTRHGGAGIIVRYRTDDGQRVYAYVGAASARQAYNYATGYVEGYGGRRTEVVAHWQDGD